MANIQSAKKQARQSERRRIRNRVVRSSMRNYVKVARLALESKDVQAAESAVQVAISQLDRAASKRIIHSNQASRSKSRLMKQLATLQAQDSK